MDIDEQGVRQIHSIWTSAVNSGDPVRLRSLMTDDVMFLNSGRTPQGPQDFLDDFLAAHQQFQISCISEPEEIAVVGEVAYTLCQDSLTMTPRAGGNAMKLAGYRITIYRKQPNGGWLLARDAYTLSPVDT